MDTTKKNEEGVTLFSKDILRKGDIKKEGDPLFTPD